MGQKNTKTYLQLADLYSYYTPKPHQEANPKKPTKNLSKKQTDKLIN
jgi:hypothetical protein